MTSQVIALQAPLGQLSPRTREKHPMTRAFQKQWLYFTSILVGGFGPVFFLGTIEATLEPARLSLDILSWPVDGNITMASSETRFLAALTGGFLLGWGITIFCLARWVYDLAPNQVRKCVVTGLCAWFLLDSAGSIASGHPSNALFNVIVLLLAVGPMWRPARA
jgi:biotin transporter BioY